MTHPLRRGLLGALALLVLACGSTAAQPAEPGPSADPLSPARFRDPGREAGVHAWWHWLDGAITREGITRDLESLATQGVVQATILNVGLFEGRDLGVPRVAFASPEWFSMFRWALAEASRLGIALGVHNCDGWSSSGGPWITPELSMKQFAWTKTLVAGGGKLDLRLGRPVAVEGFYRDVAVVAFRTTQRPSAFRVALPRLRVNGAEEAAEKLVDGCPVSALRIRRDDRLVLAAKKPLAFDRVALHVRRPFMWGEPARFTTRFAVETSRDGRAWSPLAELVARGLNRTEVLDVPSARARFVRLVVREMSDTDAWIPLELGELELLGKGESPAYSPSIPFVAEKTGSVKAAREDDLYAAGAEGGPAVAPRDVVVLTDRLEADGRLRWDAPAGSWAILRFGYTSTGATNAPATREGRGLECDKMDAAAVEHHFRSFPEKVIAEAGEHAGKALRFVLVDSWEAGFQNWTARFPAEFERRRGYSLLPWLLHAEVIYGGGDYPPLDVLRSTKEVDLPMTEFWTSADKSSLLEYAPADAPVLNLPACAAAGYGKPLLGSEAYTGFAHYSESLADLKPFGDRAFTAGINRMILHSSVHQPTDEKPGLTLGQFASHFNRNNLYWPYAAPWLTYQARIQSVLGEGTPVFDVLYYLGDQLPQYFVRNASTTLPAGYAVSAVNAEILSERVAVRHAIPPRPA